MKDIILKTLKEFNEDNDYNNSTDFIEDGLLDSFEIVNLVSELEDAFSIEISGKDILPENFVNIDAIEALIRKYKEDK